MTEVGKKPRIGKIEKLRGINYTLYFHHSSVLQDLCNICYPPDED